MQGTTFKEWLKAASVRVWFVNRAGNSQEKIITRDTLIKRVANALGSSYPSGIFDVSNKYDEAVGFSLKFKIEEIPLSYYILLKTAHDTLDCSDFLPAIAPKQVGR